MQLAREIGKHKLRAVLRSDIELLSYFNNNNIYLLIYSNI